jgi:D-alanyl-D-alanine carboxypeptidase/D-alanyl-D-alanine-endopeptidase (penicillin-binding protein 4)
VTKIILDQNFFSGASYTSAWKLSDRTNGYISHITGLQVDSDRANPDLTSKAYSGYRSTNPVNQTGKFFKEALQGLADDASLVVGRTPANAVLLTSVSSAPIGTWLQHAISVSDNTETEFIARHAAKAAGLAPRFESIEPLVVKTLAKLGVDSTGLVMKDGSGLAQANRVTPKLVAELLAKSAADTGPLSQLVSYLPVAGRSGTLATRFTGKNAMARTFVTGKSGYIPGLYSLAGIIKAKDGSKLSYAIFARSAGSKKVGYAARGALDTVATRFYQCGLGLTK